jgi:hypothetical protein
MPKIRPIPRSRDLPANVTELEAGRITARTVSLLDEVEQAFLALFEEPEFKKYRDALEDDACVEGSVFADDICAAQMIRKKAEVLGLHQVEDADLTLLSQKLRAAERRFNVARKQRANAPDDVPPTAPAAEAAVG